MDALRYMWPRFFCALKIPNPWYWIALASPLPHIAPAPTLTPLDFEFDDVILASPREVPDAALVQAAVVSLSASLDLAEESYFVIDETEADRCMNAWRRMFPDIQPYYAVKCNPEPALVRRLAQLGCCFDVASMGEIELALAAGASPDQLLFAHPCKRRCDIRSAASKGVQATVVDNVHEVWKLSGRNAWRDVFLRIYAMDPTAKCPLSQKFGAHRADWASILSAATEAGVGITGVSFHVGSGAQSGAAYEAAIEEARECFALGIAMGHAMHVLDVGGGFHVGMDPAIPASVQRAWRAFQAVYPGAVCIAEPGRFFAERSMHLVVSVLGERHHDYWVTDSIYASFNNMIYDHATLATPVVLREGRRLAFEETCSVRLWGNTCDGMDVLGENLALPVLKEGDKLWFSDMGAYTHAAACDFNGIPFTKAKKFYWDGCRVRTTWI